MRRNRLAERLRELRRARGLTQRDVARAFGITDVGYGGWERGDTEPSLDNIVRLCEFFGCSSDSLIGLAPPPPSAPTARLGELKGRLASLSEEIARASEAVDGILGVLPRERLFPAVARRSRRDDRRK